MTFFGKNDITLQGCDGGTAVMWLCESERKAIQDLDPGFVRDMVVETAWQYSESYEALAAEIGVDDGYRDEMFRRRRGQCAVEGMLRAARQHRVPFEFRRLDCNGQRKLMVKAGRVVLIQEAFDGLDEAPRAAHYKRQLADLHGIVRQLELDLGDQPHRIRDWSGCTLAVLLHGMAGPRFTRQDRALGGLMLAVPDASYGQWTMRIDLQRLAMFGETLPVGSAAADAPVQPDNVRVPLKAKHARRTGSE